MGVGVSAGVDVGVGVKVGVDVGVGVGVEKKPSSDEVKFKLLDGEDEAEREGIELSVTDGIGEGVTLKVRLNEELGSTVTFRL